MTCRAIETWTFSELVGSFLDLCITGFLLCGSALTYCTSKFLGLFGLSLPCPCNGFFGNPNSKCLQGLLVVSPSEKISKVQCLVKTKFPFDSILANDLNSQLVKERKFQNGHDGLEGESSCGSFAQEMSGKDSSVRKGSFDVKGKVVKSHRMRYGVRQRRKGAVDKTQSLFVSSIHPLLSDARRDLDSPASVSKMENEITEDNSLQGHHYVREAVREDNDMLFELDEPLDESKSIEKDVSPGEEFNWNLLHFEGNDDNKIEALEKALQEEHAARSALYLELEKERSAAATAADEAMAMIIRLQEDKASIEMEARQYQRMIEEKAAYDAEEMNILKEILIRREREKHFLEKEVEAFRHMICGVEQSDANMYEPTEGQRASSSLYSSADPVTMLQRISESIGAGEKVMDANDFPEYEVTSIQLQNCTHTLGKELPIPELDEDADSSKLGNIHGHPSSEEHQHLSRNSDESNEELQEKGMVDVNNRPINQQKEMQTLSENSHHSTNQLHTVHEKTITHVREVLEQSDSASVCGGFTSMAADISDETKIIIPYSDEKAGKNGKDSGYSMSDRDLCVHDVHVVVDELSRGNEESGNNSDLPKNLILDIPRTCDRPPTCGLETEVNMKRSTSDTFSGLPPHMGISRGKALLSDFRRNSMSAFDYERLKIDNEVGRLRERLMVVQEGRERLNFSVGRRESEKIQLQLLEDIANQLRDIRQLAEPGKAARQVSLPPFSSKVISKKRRCRSVSLGSQRSN